MSLETSSRRYHTQHSADVTRLNRPADGQINSARGGNEMADSTVGYSQVDCSELSTDIRNGLFKKTSANGIATLIGRCPRCGHDFSFSFPVRPMVVTPGSYVTGQSGSGSLTAPHQEHTIFCSCTYEHEGRPEDEVGCGAMTRLLLRKRQP